MGVAIVAIPSDRDPVWKYSSEKVPHMTLLFLGDQANNPTLSQTIEYVEYVATYLTPFMMSVESRGTLGLDNADVLFFNKDYYGKALIDQTRRHLLQNENIRKAYETADQYPEWTPHLTMGYPDNPAKKDDRDYGFDWVDFDRLAIWTEKDSGPEFKLKYPKLEEANMVMSDKTSEFLEHYGIRGMRWGIRREDASIPSGEVRVTQKKPGTRVTTAGGKNISAHPDAVKAATTKQKAKSSTIDSLSNKELQELVTRMNLEQQYSRLATSNKSTLARGSNKIKEILDAKGTLDRVLNDPTVKPHINRMASEIFNAIRN